MIQLMSIRYFDLFMLTADMYLGTKNMDKVHIRASLKTTLLIPPPLPVQKYTGTKLLPALEINIFTRAIFYCTNLLTLKFNKIVY